MGWDLELYVDDESIPPPVLWRSFFYEIVWGRLFDLEAILTEEEAEILQPNEMGEVVVGQKDPVTPWDWFRILKKMKQAILGSKDGYGDPGAVFDHVLDLSEAVEDRERDPLLLKKVLEKLEQYLIDHPAELPVVHFLFRDPERTEQVEFVTVDGNEYSVYGDLDNIYEAEKYEAYRNKLYLQPNHNAHAKSILVEVAPKITIDEVVYYTRTLSMAEVYADQFSAAYDFLDKAASKGKKVLWEYF